jgi:hypothetical protein
VPAQLLGDWFLPPAAAEAIDGNVACKLLQLTLTATTYQITHTALGVCDASSSGGVVVNGTEIDFFNGDHCGLQLPDGVGRYTWTLTAGVLHFTLISDPCGRAAMFPEQSWSRTA